MKKTIKNISFALVLLCSVLGANSCNNYLDVVPDDGLASVETAFSLRSTAIRYLATCYSYMTHEGEMGSDPGLMTSDELWDTDSRVAAYVYNKNNYSFPIAKGLQSASTCYNNDWARMYEGIRTCDILLENIDGVPDMEEDEKEQWKAEANFLKAYYHFNLIRKWGPIPVIRESLPIDSDVEEVRVYRDNIDDCFDFVLDLLDEAMPYLPLVNPSNDELGRITKPACAGLKARVAVYAASPLFNGNDEEASLIDGRGQMLFPTKSDTEKMQRWEYAMEACEEALDVCEEANLKLYTKLDIQNDYRMCDTLLQDLSLRNAVTQRWNSEIVWGNTQVTMTSFQQYCIPILQTTEDGRKYGGIGGWNFIGVPLKIAEQFYTKNGLPISYDAEFSTKDQFALRTGDDANAYYIEKGYETIQLNFDREPRFYSSLGFDGGKWLGALSNYNDLKPEDVHTLNCRYGMTNGKSSNEKGPVTGYLPKKLAPYRVIWSGNATSASLSAYWFPWPMIRLSDIYLLYAEAINEVEGPNGAHSVELFEAIDAIRERAGIPDVKTSWDEYSTRPGYYKTQVGMREIIHKERLNELAFESQRYWDLRRWKEASAEYQKGIYGLRVNGMSAKDYNQKTFIFEQNFGLKDYFWPIYTPYIERNPNLVQNLGW